MKIDRVYIICNRKDFYFTKICVASIRYWNKEINISLIKDFSNGTFDSAELENAFHVAVAQTHFSNLSYYAKLHPFIDGKLDERVMILDSDIVWMGNLAAILEAYDEDIIVDGYNPPNLDEELNKWYFNTSTFRQAYPNYQYPGFLFNVGQLVCNTSIFSRDDFTPFIEWKNNPLPHNNAFFYEQGILNYIVSEKVKNKKISYRLQQFHRWGWDAALKSIGTAKLKKHEPLPYLIHWYGKKNGLTGFLPCSEVLKFYEDYYYSFIKNGNAKLLIAKIGRSLRHFDSFLYESAKWVYYQFKNKPV